MDFLKWLRTYMPTPDTKFRPSSDYGFVYRPGNLQCYTVFVPPMAGHILGIDTSQ